MRTTPKVPPSPHVCWTAEPCFEAAARSLGPSCATYASLERANWQQQGQQWCKTLLTTAASAASTVSKALSNKVGMRRLSRPNEIAVPKVSYVSDIVT